MIKDGKLRALAVTSESRSLDLPDVPTMSESGLAALTQGFWLGVLAPVRTPTSVVDHLNKHINESLNSPDMRDSMAKLGFEPKVGSPEDFGRFLAADVRTWAEIVKSAGVKTN